MIHLHCTQAVAFRVLVVDADPIQREILARCVAMLGWTADTAADLDEALDACSGRPHNTVVIDLDVADSERLLRRLRAGGPSVIFVTEPGDRGHAGIVQTARDLGLRVAGTLARPVDPYGLHALLLANPISKAASHGVHPSPRDLDQALREGEIHTEYQ